MAEPDLESTAAAPGAPLRRRTVERRDLAAPPPRLSGDEIARLVERVRSGDRAAWETIVRCLSPAVYRGIGAFTLAPEARDDVFANTWVRLLERIDTIEKPASLVSWLMSTARNEASQFVRTRSRQVPVAQVRADVDGADLAEGLLEDELRVAVRRAFLRLTPECQRMLRLLTIGPPITYEQATALLGMPHGSIGPKRGRCLDALRRRPELRPFLQDLAPEAEHHG